MARKMQKMMALVLALTLTAGQIAVPALAAGTEEPIVIPGENTTVTTDGNTVTTKGSVTTADGTVITVEEKVTTDPATGTTTSTTDTTRVNSESGMSSSNSISSTTSTENLGSGGNKTTTDTQSKWSSSNTIDNTTTSTEGSQSSHHESTVDSQGRPLNESSSLSGQESTTTTTTTSNENSEPKGSEENRTPGEFVENKEAGKKEVEKIPGSETDETIIGSADIGDLTIPGASITVTPNGQEVVTTVELTPEQIQQILDNDNTPLNIPKPADFKNATVTEEGFTYTQTIDGKDQVVKVQYIYGTGNLANTIIGYTQTTYTTINKKEVTSTETKQESTTTIGEPNGSGNRKPQRPNVLEGQVTNQDGSVTDTTVTEIRSKAGEVIGYKIVKQTTSADGKQTSTDIKTEYSTEITSSSNTTFTLPTKPSGGTVKNADGTTTVTTVEDIVEKGQVVGYKTTRVTTSPDGLYKYTESESIYGTETTKESQTATAKREETESTETTTTKTVTTTTLIFYDAEGYQLVWDTNGNQWVYKATMSQVRDDGVDMSGGNQTDDGLTILDETGNKRSLLEPVYVIDTSKGGKDLEARSKGTEGKAEPGTRPQGYDYIYKGVRSLGSKYRVEAGNDKYKAHLFELEKLDKEGETTGKFYAYCVDMGTNALSNYYYKFENLEDATYMTKEQREHLKAISMNGYWGTDEGTDTNNPNLGSLVALRKKLVEAGIFTEEDAAKLTDGEALTATQAALWKYGNSSTTLQVNDSQSSGYHNVNGNWEPNSEAGQRINKVYQWLIGLKSTGDEEPTQIIDKNNFATSATIKVKNEVTAAEGETSEKKYNTDISFTMNVKKSSLTGNLKLEIKEGNKVIKSVWIATEDSNLVGELLANIKDTDNGSTITIPDVELSNGTAVTLTLSGAQKLKTGAYLYTSEVYNGKSSQSFVTLAEGENAVNLSVDLTLTVTEPTVQVQDPGRGKKEQVTTTQVFEKVDKSNSSSQYQDTYEQITTTSKTKRSWTAELLRSWKYEEPPKEEHPKGNDKDVPLAEAPKTGDNAWLWAVVCLSSLAGAVLLGKKKERA